MSDHETVRSAARGVCRTESPTAEILRQHARHVETELRKAMDAGYDYLAVETVVDGSVVRTTYTPSVGDAPVVASPHAVICELWRARGRVDAPE